MDSVFVSLGASVAWCECCLARLKCSSHRFVFGLGGESLTVAQNTFTVRWFEGRTLALVFGLVVAFARCVDLRPHANIPCAGERNLRLSSTWGRVGSSVNFVVTPLLANESVVLACWVGFGTCCLSFLACVTLGVLDWCVFGEDWDGCGVWLTIFSGMDRSACARAV